MLAAHEIEHPVIESISGSRLIWSDQDIRVEFSDSFSIVTRRSPQNESTPEISDQGKLCRWLVGHGLFL